MIRVGESVIFVDQEAVQHIALVTAVWSEQCINVVFVNADASMHDSYGRQIARQTSLMNKDTQGATYGMYWMLPGETANPIVAPLES